MNIPITLTDAEARAVLLQIANYKGIPVLMSAADKIQQAIGDAQIATAKEAYRRTEAGEWDTPFVRWWKHNKHLTYRQALAHWKEARHD